MRMRNAWMFLSAFLLVPARACGQDSSDRLAAQEQSKQMPTMSDEHHKQMGMNEPDMMHMNMQPETFIETVVHHGSSGTSVEPNSTPVPMLMTLRGNWALMFHANVFVLDEQQSGERGGDKFFSTNWFMGMAQRKLGPGPFT